MLRAAQTRAFALIHKFTYRRTNHANFHVHGYKEKGNINTPLELAIESQLDRSNLAIDAIDRVSSLQATGAHFKEWLKRRIIESIRCAHTEGIDAPEIRNWTWSAIRSNRLNVYFARGVRCLGGGWYLWHSMRSMSPGITSAPSIASHYLNLSIFIRYLHDMDRELLSCCQEQ